MKLLATLTLLAVCLISMAQDSSAKKWIDTEVRFTHAAGKFVMIQNSLPRGGGGYLDAHGKKYSYVIFWMRVMNESATPIELAMHFDAAPFTIFNSTDSHIRILLPGNSMTPDKITMGDYGLTELQSIIDTAFDKPAILQRTISPNKDCYFYVPILLYQAQGTARAALVLKNEDLFFKISIGKDTALIPCGRIFRITK